MEYVIEAGEGAEVVSALAQAHNCLEVRIIQAALWCER